MHPLAFITRNAAGWLEAVASIETMRAVVVFVCPEAKPPTVLSSYLGEDTIEELSANSLAPARRNDVKIAEEQASRDHRARPIIIPHRLGAGDANHGRCIFGHEQPRARFAQASLKTRDARRLMRPDSVAASEVRLSEHSDRCAKIRIVSSPNPNCHAERLEPHMGQCSGTTPEEGLLRGAAGGVVCLVDPGRELLVEIVRRPQHEAMEGELLR